MSDTQERTRSVELWSDLDGTGLTIFSNIDPRKWGWYMLSMVDGYDEFIRGALSGGQLRMGGLVSSRPNFSLVHDSTRRSLERVGLAEVFPDRVLTGSQRSKAGHIIERSRESAVALIENNPRKVGTCVVEMLTRGEIDLTGSPRTVAIGAVYSLRRQPQLEQLQRFADEQQGVEVDPNEAGFDIAVGESVVSIVQLDRYSFDAGTEFAERIAS